MKASSTPDAGDPTPNNRQGGAAVAPRVLAVTGDHWSAARSMLTGRSQATVLAAMSPQQPDGLMRAFLVTARQLGTHLTLMFGDLSGALAFLDEAAASDVDAGRLRLVSVAGGVPKHWSRRVDQLSYSLWDIDRMLRLGVIPVDIVLAKVRAGARPGQVGFGEMVGYTPSALDTRAAAVFELQGGADGGDFHCSQA
ncbi:MAG: hypothetical protein V4609_07870, partial [Pseudomonadota bacterium]